MAPSIPRFDLGRAIFSFLVITLSVSTIQALSEDPASPLPSVYEILPKYGLPSGLLPDSVVSYTLDDDDLEGIKVQKLFLWLDVDKIEVDLPPADSIYFHVGFINKKLDVDQFETVHSCRDGVSGTPCKGFWKRAIEVLKF
ncbi:unnamed protein product [Linum tenue]|uniref:Uncharacterized protein n=1 Tax=Linum tenue TaxID=586396 RepID=A0AAV0M3X9_9ROSI|nr:unnamed protein product [Linum tenue]